MRCFLWHKWGEPDIDGPYAVKPSFAATFGNGFVVKRCSRCRKVSRKPIYIKWWRR